MQEIKFIENTHLKEKPKDQSKLGFGKIFTDYMFTMEYNSKEGWHNAQVRPYENLSFDPATTFIHYGQAFFEGMKAYNAVDGVRLFRPMDNFARATRSAERLAMPALDEDLAMEGLKLLLKVEKDWIPTAPGTSLYIRPTMVATDVFLGVHASDSYLFFIILSPVGAYYAAGLQPVKIYVEDEYVRAARGGIGFTKAAANYAASIYAGELAEKKGYSQVLWLDAVERKYIEEVGAMNMFFVIDGRDRHPAAARLDPARHHARLGHQARPQDGLRRAGAPDLHRRGHGDRAQRPHERGLRLRHRGGHQPRGRLLPGEGGGPGRRRRHRPDLPEAVRHADRHPVRPHPGRDGLVRQARLLNRSVRPPESAPFRGPFPPAFP